MAVVLLGLVSGCSSAVSGTAQPPVAPHLVPGTLQASLLTIEETSKLLGVMLTSSNSTSEPPAALPAEPAACAVSVGPASQAVYAPGWTLFGSAMYQDSDGVADHTVNQVLATYPSADQASAVLRTLTDGLTQCPAAERNDGDDDVTKWLYAVETRAPDSVIWTATQDGGEGWACYRQARLKGKSVAQVALCQAGDGKQAAARITDQFLSKVSG